VLVTTLPAQLIQGSLQLPEVVLVEAAGALGAMDVLGQRLYVLRAGKLIVVRGADVHQGAEGGGPVSRVEGRVVDGVAVDLADIEVLLHFIDPGGLDAVGRSPHPLGRRLMVVYEALPVGFLDQRHDAPRLLGCSAMILAVLRGRRKKGRVG